MSAENYIRLGKVRGVENIDALIARIETITRESAQARVPRWRRAYRRITRPLAYWLVDL